MIIEKFFHPPFTLKAEISALEVGYLLEIEGRVRPDYAPAMRRFALADLTAVAVMLRHETSRFMGDVDTVVAAAKAARGEAPE